MCAHCYLKNMLLSATRLPKVEKFCDFKAVIAPEMGEHTTWHSRTRTEA